MSFCHEITEWAVFSFDFSYLNLVFEGSVYLYVIEIIAGQFSDLMPHCLAVKTRLAVAFFFFFGKHFFIR